MNVSNLDEKRFKKVLKELSGVIRLLLESSTEAISGFDDLVLVWEAKLKEFKATGDQGLLDDLAASANRIKPSIRISLRDLAAIKKGVEEVIGDRAI